MAGGSDIKLTASGSGAAGKSRKHEPVQVWYATDAGSDGPRLRLAYAVRRPVDAVEILHRQAEIAPAAEALGLVLEWAPAKPPRRGAGFDVALGTGSARLTVFAAGREQRAALAAAFRRVSNCRMTGPKFGVLQLLGSLVGATAIGVAVWGIETAVIGFAPAARAFVPLLASSAIDGLVAAVLFLPVLVAPRLLAALRHHFRMAALDAADARATRAAAGTDRADPAS
jgi:hypothetical protein